MIAGIGMRQQRSSEAVAQGAGASRFAAARLAARAVPRPRIGRPM